MKRNFLVVAANGPIREDLADGLRAQGYTVTLASNGREAVRVVKSVSVDAALIEASLPDQAAERLRARILKARPRCRAVIVTNFDLVRKTPDLLRFGRCDYLVRGEEVTRLMLAPFEAGKTAGNATFSERGNEALVQVIDVLVGLLQVDERFFGGSSHHAMQLTREVAEAMSADQETVREIVVATLIRDVGKVGVEAELLNGESEFSSEQKERMREHVPTGLRLFEHIEFPWKVLPIIRHHHERYDGKGYPDGLQGREIPMGARIVAVVDAYVAMVARRGHRAARTPQEALQELIRGAGQQFDPEVVEVFQGVLSKRFEGRPSAGNARVLILEPQEDFRKLLKMRLLNLRCDVEEAADKERALETILKLSPDLLLVDVDETGSEAFDLLRELQDDETLCRVPVVFLSRRSDRVLKLRALRLGVDEFLSKEDLEAIGAHVEGILMRQQLRSGSAPNRAPQGITGSLEDFALADIVQTLAIGMKTASVTIDSDDRRGEVWFENGTPRHARSDALEGAEAFYQMLRWQGGVFVIQHGVQCKKRSLHDDAMFLLMEGMRLMDEAGDGQSAPAAS